MILNWNILLICVTLILLVFSYVVFFTKFTHYQGNGRLKTNIIKRIFVVALLPLIVAVYYYKSPLANLAGVLLIIASNIIFLFTLILMFIVPGRKNADKYDQLIESRYLTLNRTFNTFIRILLFGGYGILIPGIIFNIRKGGSGDYFLFYALSFFVADFLVAIIRLSLNAMKKFL